MRARRTDADLEKIEDGKKHALSNHARGKSSISTDRLVVAAAPENKWLALGIVLEIENFADKDHMIAALVGIGGPAFELRQRIGQDGAAGLPRLVVDAAPFVAERA